MKKRVVAFMVFALVAVVMVLRQGPPRTQGGFKDGDGENENQVVEHFTLEGFDENGDTFWELKGDVAHVKSNINVFIEENVVLNLRDSTVVNADKVYWRNDQARFLTNQPVTITHEGHVIQGIGATGKASEEFLQINREIRMVLEGPIFVKCIGPLKIYRKKNFAVFYREVEIKDQKGTLLADRVEVNFDGENNAIREIVAIGNVRIKRGENVSISDRAIYNTGTQSVKLVGKPRIQVMEGDLPELNKARK